MLPVRPAHRRWRIAGGFVATLLLAGPAASQEDEPPGIGNCVVVDRIDASRILDDETIRLDIAGGPPVMMHLARRCPQLRFHGFFTYEPTFGQLCAAIDSVVTRAGERCEIAGFSPAPPNGQAATGKARP